MNPSIAVQKDNVDAYLDSVEHLPPSPTLLAQLIGLFRMPDRDVDEVVKLMRTDPSLTAEVLRCCNSSYYGYSEPISDIGEAVFRIGFYEVYRLSVALFGLNAIGKAGGSGAVQVEQLWRHSAITAISAGVTAKILRDADAIAFTAGLLHDVGKIVLASDTEKYAGLLKQHGQFGPALDDAEKSTFGFGHAAVGARLLCRWGVPAQVSVPVFCHHDADWSGPHERLAAIVHLANLLAHHIEANDPNLLPQMTRSLSLLGFGAAEIPGLEDRIREEITRSLSFYVSGGSK